MRIPCSSSRRYLSGADWLVHALYDTSVRTTGLGNSSLIVLEMEGVLELSHFDKTVQCLFEEIPFLSGSASRDWTLAPFWKLDQRKPVTAPVIVQTLEEDVSENSIQGVLQDWANQPFGSDRDYLTFRILRLGSVRCYLTMQFDHRLFDAGGAELFLELLGRVFSGRIKSNQVLNEIRLTEPAHLDRWHDNFLGGRTLIRLRNHYLEKQILTLPTPHHKHYQDHLVVRFTIEETRKHETQVRNHAGYLMTLPYGLSVAALVFGHLAHTLKAPRRDFLASCSIDHRHLSLGQPTIFFNYLSFMFFEINQSHLEDRPALIQSLKQQFYENTKQQFPEQLSRALLLMRILPKKIFSRLLPSWMQICFGSFNFAFLGQCNLTEELFCGQRLVNVFHCPRIPPQTGAGIYFNKYGERLNMTMTLHRGMLDQQQRATLMGVARRACLE